MDSFVYLDCLQSSGGQCRPDLKHCIGCAASTMSSLSRICKDKRFCYERPSLPGAGHVSPSVHGGDMDITEDSGSLSYEMPATDLRYPLDRLTTSATRLSRHIPVSRQLASKLLAVTSQSLAILPDWVRRSQPTRLSLHTSTYHLVACLVGTGSVVLVDWSIRFITTSATCSRRYVDQPFFMAMAQK